VPFRIELYGNYISDEVTGFFNWPNSCSRAVATERRTQPLTETTTRNIIGCNGGQMVRKACKSTDICEPTVYNCGLKPGVRENILRDM
jgi:hypothetical protein